METDKRVMTMKENLTLEIVEERLKKIAKAHGLDLMDERVPWHYGKEYGGLPNEIADIFFPRYGFVIKGMSDAIRKKLMCK